MVYEKKYTQLLDDIDDAIFENTCDSHLNTVNTDNKNPLQRILGNIVFVLMKERIEASVFFIETAKEMGDYYQIDTLIKKHNDRISVTYSLESGVNFPKMKKMIAIADDISFCNDGRFVLLTLLFYTHASYRFGKRINPSYDGEL